MEPNEQPTADDSAKAPRAAISPLARAARWLADNPAKVAAVASGVALGVDVAVTVARFYQQRHQLAARVAETIRAHARVSEPEPEEVIKPADYTVRE